MYGIKERLESRKFFVTQSSYIEKILKKFSINNSKPVSTPLASHFKFSSQQSLKTYGEKIKMESIPYSSVMGSIMYAMIRTNLDLVHSISMVSRYMQV